MKGMLDFGKGVAVLGLRMTQAILEADRPDAAHVVTPPPLHEATTLPLLAAGVPEDRIHIERFGDAVLVVRFEDYVADRQRTVDRVGDFVGSRVAAPVDDAVVHNPTSGTHVTTGVVHRPTNSGPYRRFVQPLFPRTLRDRMRAAVGHEPVEPGGLSATTAARIGDALAEDLARLPELVGDPGLVW